MSKIYFEAKGEELLEKLGISKSEFARRMGIRKQNVKALFKTKNLETIYKAASVLEVPFELLVGYIEEPDLQFFPLDEEDLSFVEECVITENDVPTGDSVEDRRKRQKLIFDFYSD